MLGPKQPHIDVEDFVKLLLDNQRRVFTYILTLVPNVADAEDIMQEVSIVLWRKFPEYEAGTNFAAWAYRVAYNTVRTFRVKQLRCRVKFDDELLAMVATETESMREELEISRQILTDCEQKLSPDDRELLKARYQAGTTVRSLAAAVGRSVEGMYKAMRRIHDALYDCVQRRLASEEIHVRQS
jgi:RNA polymerase sigma-70 factor, ECF subfamily